MKKEEVINKVLEKFDNTYREINAHTSKDDIKPFIKDLLNKCLLDEDELENFFVDLDEEEYIEMNVVDQWATIRSKELAKAITTHQINKITKGE